ncbi:MAG TPA: hypothetical protein VH187_01630 [Scandinavium sp.]|jgi:hypothetical protein|uniref:hypothetical protein n=1 Tax=Scandinavium sp. TaxID=2830653 RepID=UPI002E362B5E|nr:hypothetical protein [Scandinavium sp.]HEX4499859.1 hypothetical protein [Scandinavium sp.]
MATIADLVVNLSANIAEFKTSMNEAKSSITDLRDTIVDTSHAVAEFLAVREVISFFREATNATLEWAHSIDELSSKTGLTAQAASDLAASAREQGVSLQQLDGFLDAITRRIVTKPAEFKAFGIAIHDTVTGGLLPMTVIGDRVLKTLGEYIEGSNRAAAATALLGRQGPEIVANWEALSKAFDAKNLKEAGDYIRALGLEIDASGIAKAKEWAKAEEDLRLAFLAIENQVGQALLPVLKDFADWIKEHAKDYDIQRWFLEFARVTLELAKAIIELTQFLIELKESGFGQLYSTISRVVDGMEVGSTKIHNYLVAMSGVGHTVATSAAAGAAGAHSATGALDELTASIDKQLAHLGEHTATVDKANKGTKTYSDSLNVAGGNAITTADRFEKLKLKLTNEIDAQQRLAVAVTQGSVATKAANTENQIATNLFTLYNEKTGEAVSRQSAMGQAVDTLTRRLAEQQTAVATNTAMADLGNQIADQQQLADAALHGVAATQAATTAIRAEVEIRRLAIDTHSANADKIREEYQALDQLTKLTTTESDYNTLQRQVDQQKQLVGAYSESTRAGKDLAAQFEIQNKLAELGIPLTREWGQKYLEMAADASRTKDQLDQMKKQASENDQAFSSMIDATSKFGEDVVGAFENGKNASKSFKQQVIDDFKTMIDQIEHDLLKLLVFDKIKAALENAVNGTGQGGSAGTGGSGGLFGGLFGGGSTSSSDIQTASQQTNMPSSAFAGSSYAGGGSGLLGWLGSLFGGGGGGAASGAATAGVAESFAEGGMVWGPRDVVPILAHRGEQIIPANQVGRRGMSITQNFMISTPDANSFRAAHSHIAADANRAAMAAARRS